MGSRHTRISPAARTLLAVLAVTVGAGCEHPVTSTTDYRVEHRLTAEERVFSLHLDIADNALRFEPVDETNLRRFAQEYIRRGRGPFLIAAAGTDDAASRRVFDKVAAVVVDAGIPGDRVYFQARRDAKAPSTRTQLSFSGYFVRLPECGDWSGETGFAPTNQPHSDFGCSYQRNFGLMLANPGDLRVSRGEPAYDAIRTDRVTGTYRNPDKAIGRPRPTQEQQDFSDIK